MLAKSAKLSLALLLGAGVCAAQRSEAVVKANQPDASQINCAGFYTDQKVGGDAFLVSGEESLSKLTFNNGDYVHINRGMNQGVKEGDLFNVVRQESDPDKVSWFKWQPKLIKAMGEGYVDLGQLKVIKVQPKISIAQVIFSCGPMQRGDILLPYQPRPVGPFKDPGKFDHFAPVSGKPVAMVVTSKDYAQSAGQRDTIYVNLGTAQGVKLGDYFRIFRYQGTRAETAPMEKDYQFKLYGYGSAPQRYEWNDLPREILGEGIVMNVSKNSSSVLVTYTSSEVYAGDYVEVE
ncbi:MAG TPA: hypothetical protein VN025_02770 [Candidatus Dormibacteraeota bacterium]|jgi:hypothetical protein|nr:hypothetical protein [Candidatus Dormibacteraeota bacterium]